MVLGLHSLFVKPIMRDDRAVYEILQYTPGNIAMLLNDSGAVVDPLTPQILEQSEFAVAIKFLYNYLKKGAFSVMSSELYNVVVFRRRESWEAESRGIHGKIRV